MPTLLELIFVSSPVVALFIYWKTYKSLQRLTVIRDEIAGQVDQVGKVVGEGEDSHLTDREWEILVISTTALCKCRLILPEYEPPKDLLDICFRYITIDEKQTKAEIFDALCKRLMDHFLPKEENSIDTPS